MEEARKRLRMCLIFVVMLAVIVGCVYYFGENEKADYANEGTLVMAQREEGRG